MVYTSCYGNGILTMVSDVATRCFIVISNCNDWIYIGRVGVDFSIHIANRIKEMGGGIEAIRSSCVSTGMSLFEAACVTTAGLAAAYKFQFLN